MTLRDKISSSVQQKNYQYGKALNFSGRKGVDKGYVTSKWLDASSSNFMGITKYLQEAVLFYEDINNEHEGLNVSIVHSFLVIFR